MNLPNAMIAGETDHFLFKRRQAQHKTSQELSAPESLANFKLAAERGLITQLNGRGSFKQDASLLPEMVQK